MRRIFLMIIVLALCFTETGYVGETSEYRIKAAYMYNFTKFIHWPDSAFSNQTAPLVIGVLGKNYFDEELTPLGSRTVNSRPIEIIFFKTLEEVRNCHMLYISTSDPAETEEMLRELGARPIITIGDSQNFAAKGGVIQFVMLRSKLRFVINLANAKINQIQIDAQLISLATEVLDTDK